MNWMEMPLWVRCCPCCSWWICLHGTFRIISSKKTALAFSRGASQRYTCGCKHRYPSSSRRMDHPWKFHQRLVLLSWVCPLVCISCTAVSETLFTYFNHANISFTQDGLDKTIGLVFVSPDMHKFHHHYINARNWIWILPIVFSIWDRVFGTLCVWWIRRRFCHGIDTLDDSLDEKGFQLKVPFDHKIQVTRNRRKKEVMC